MRRGAETTYFWPNPVFFAQTYSDNKQRSTHSFLAPTHTMPNTSRRYDWSGGFPFHYCEATISYPQQGTINTILESRCREHPSDQIIPATKLSSYFSSSLFSSSSDTTNNANAVRSLTSSSKSLPDGHYPLPAFNPNSPCCPSSARHEYGGRGSPTAHTGRCCLWILKKKLKKAHSWPQLQSLRTCWTNYRAAGGAESFWPLKWS